MSDVLLVDDDGELLQTLARALSPRIAPLTSRGATTPAMAREFFQRDQPRVVVLDLCLDERLGVESGFQLLSEFRSLGPAVRIMVLTGHGSIEHGVRALSLGAASFIEKPVEPEHLAALIIDGVAQADLKREYDATIRQEHAGMRVDLCGGSSAMKTLREQISFVASTHQPVLILGETGTGKGLCARLVHERSGRRGENFIHYQPNFGGGDIAQSELFGHRKGAFTGASDDRVGLALLADRGTLFLDELDEVPPEVQVRLLDLIQERRVRAIGADTFKKVDCRFVAAMNRPLDEALSANRLRRDLYHRLAHNVIFIPPLRDRIEDIPELCRMILATLRKRELLEVVDVEPDVLERFRDYSWPGNVRELQGVVERAAYHAHYKSRSVITGDDIIGRHFVHHPSSEGSFQERVERFKTRLISEALERCNGNQVRAARMLGLDRSTLRRILGRVSPQ
jgi:DNA-binding NtrC family response regulator